MDLILSYPLRLRSRSVAPPICGAKRMTDTRAVSISIVEKMPGKIGYGILACYPNLDPPLMRVYQKFLILPGPVSGEQVTYYFYFQQIKDGSRH